MRPEILNTFCPRTISEKLKVYADEQLYASFGKTNGQFLAHGTGILKWADEDCKRFSITTNKTPEIPYLHLKFEAKHVKMLAVTKDINYLKIFIFFK